MQKVTAIKNKNPLIVINKISKSESTPSPSLSHPAPLTISWDFVQQSWMKDELKCRCPQVSHGGEKRSSGCDPHGGHLAPSAFAGTAEKSLLQAWGSLLSSFLHFFILMQHKEAHGTQKIQDFYLVSFYFITFYSPVPCTSSSASHFNYQSEWSWLFLISNLDTVSRSQWTAN